MKYITLHLITHAIITFFLGSRVGKLISSQGISIWLAIIAAYCVEFETCQAIAFQIGCALAALYVCVLAAP